ncbi:hypothetical protein QE435_002537 [Rhizobium sp. SORGH_AS 787]|nr:hypothetical protein [Rhizobium sp. SORGH_AS_0787]
MDPRGGQCLVRVRAQLPKRLATFQMHDNSPWFVACLDQKTNKSLMKARSLQAETSWRVARMFMSRRRTGLCTRTSSSLMKRPLQITDALDALFAVGTVVMGEGLQHELAHGDELEHAVTAILMERDR